VTSQTEFAPTSRYAPAGPTSSDTVTSDTVPVADPLRRAAAACSLGAAAIHFMVMGEHFREWWLYGTFFAVAAWLQVAWAGLLIARRTSRGILALGAVGQLGIVVLWLVTRTTGLPFGPNTGSAEAVGAADVVCSIFEALAGGAALLLLLRLRHRRIGRVPAAVAAGALALAVAGATTAINTPAVAGGETAAGAAGGMPGMAGHTHAADGSTTTVAGTAAAPMAVGGDIPAGWSAGCMHHMATGNPLDSLGHGPGACTEAPVTPAQRAAAERLAATTTAAVVPRFSRLADAQKAGYRPVNITGPLWHVANPAFQTDGRVLDPQRPESLVYYVPPDRTKSILLGAMFIEDTYGAPGPLIGGALTSWHSHINLCVDAKHLTAFNPQGGVCAPGSHVAPTSQMLHVWTVPYDGGPFAEISVEALTKAVVGRLSGRS